MPPLGKSDHDIIYAEINVRPNRMCTPHRKVFVFRKADWDGIKRKLNALFEKMQENAKQPPVNELWNTFKITLLDGMREFIPQKMTTSKHCLPWVTLNIRKLMRSKRRLHTKFKKTQCPKVLDKYKEMRHTLQREIRKSYWAYIEDIIDYTAATNNDRQTKQKKSGHTLNIFAKILPASLLFEARVRPSVTHHAKPKYLMISSPQFSRMKHLAPILTKGPVPTLLCQISLYLPPASRNCSPT